MSAGAGGDRDETDGLTGLIWCCLMKHVNRAITNLHQPVLDQVYVKFTSSPGSASCSSPSSVRWSWSTLQANAQTHRTPKAIAPEARGATITTWTVVSVADTLHNRLHFLRNSCSTQGANSRRPEPQCTAATYLFNTVDGAQASYPSTTHISTTASIPYLQGAPSV